VPAQHSKPYSFGGKFFVREGASSQQMSREQIREFFYKEGLIHFDETPCDRFTLADDLTDDVWALFRRRAKIPVDMEAITALENLHLFKDGKMSHAGAWLLALDIRKFNISADVACALFLGTDKVRILDRRGFSSDVYSMIDEVVAYILSKINIEYIIKHVKREERPELPEEALREAVVNALAHRDYRSTANVQVYVFRDRVEIVSPGGLPAGMTEADLGTKSIPRNPLLFAILHRMEAVEHIGSGIRRIRNLCKEYGVAEPEIEVAESWFTVRFPRPELPDGGKPAESSLAQVASQATQSPIQSPTQSPTQSTDPVVRLLRQLEKGAKSSGELRKALNLSHRPSFRRNYLHPALDRYLIELTMPDKPTSSKQKYRLTDKGRKTLIESERK
jgi:ATP-dependent DNA helicase RecG